MNVKRILSVLQCVAFAVVVPWAVHAGEYRHPVQGYSLQLPDGWKAVPGKSPEDCDYYPPDEGCLLSVDVTPGLRSDFNQDMSNTEIMGKYEQAFESSLRGSAPDLREIGKTQRMLDGCSAEQKEYLFQQDGRPVHLISVIFIQNRDLYQIWGYYPDSNGPRCRSGLEAVISSFVCKDEPKQHTPSGIRPLPSSILQAAPGITPPPGCSAVQESHPPANLMEVRPVTPKTPDQPAAVPPHLLAVDTVPMPGRNRQPETPVRALPSVPVPVISWSYTLYDNQDFDLSFERPANWTGQAVSGTTDGICWGGDEGAWNQAILCVYRETAPDGKPLTLDQATEQVKIQAELGSGALVIQEYRSTLGGMHCQVIELEEAAGIAPEQKRSLHILIDRPSGIVRITLSAPDSLIQRLQPVENRLFRTLAPSGGR